MGDFAGATRSALVFRNISSLCADSARPYRVRADRRVCFSMSRYSLAVLLCGSHVRAIGSLMVHGETGMLEQFFLSSGTSEQDFRVRIVRRRTDASVIPGAPCWQTQGRYFPSHWARCLQRELSNMNKDQVKGTAKDVVGKVQEEAGRLVGNKDQQIKGLAKQISGKLQKSVGDVKESLEDSKKG